MVCKNSDLKKCSLTLIAMFTFSAGWGGGFDKQTLSPPSLVFNFTNVVGKIEMGNIVLRAGLKPIPGQSANHYTT